MDPISEFAGKGVVVTGGAKGIGRAICLAFAREGGRVMCIDTDEDAGSRLAEEGAEARGEIHFHRADVAIAKQCRKVIEEAEATIGGVDVLCNNAGIQPIESYVRAHELPEDLWDRILDVNLKSAFLMAKVVIPGMRETGGGVIINTASVQGLQSMKQVAAYAASKGGMLSLTRQLALDYAEDNIRVLAVNPGTIETPLVRDAASAGGLSMEEARVKGARSHPIGRIGRPEEVAEVVLFLASERAGFMTGEFVNVDGGVMAKGAWAS